MEQGLLREQLDAAYKRWQQAITLFDNASAKDEIDYAIFNMEAKKRQYLRLLAEYKRAIDPDFGPDP